MTTSLNTPAERPRPGLQFLAAGLCGLLLAGALAAPASAHPHAKAVAAKPGLVEEGTNLYLVFANAVPGQEIEFGRWYDEHSQIIIKQPGFVRAQRFQAQPRAGKPNPAFGYMTIYEFKGDTDTVMAGLVTAAKEGRLHLPDPRYVVKTEAMVYRALNPGFENK